MENLTLETFKEKIMDFDKNKDWKFEGELPAIVDFSADSWCVPCKKLTPILDKLQKEYSGRINIYKVDVDNESEIASVFNIRSVPTMLFCKTDSQPEISTGSLPEYKLKEIIEGLILLQ